MGYILLPANKYMQIKSEFKKNYLNKVMTYVCLYIYSDTLKLTCIYQSMLKWF